MKVWFQWGPPSDRHVSVRNLDCIPGRNDRVNVGGEERNILSISWIVDDEDGDPIETPYVVIQLSWSVG